MHYAETVLRLLAVIGGLAMSAGAVWIVVRRPVRYVYGHLFGDPVGAWCRKQVTVVVQETLLKRNGGTTVPDAIDRIERVEAKLDQHVATVQDWQRQLVQSIGVDTRTANTEQTASENRQAS